MTFDIAQLDVSGFLRHDCHLYYATVQIHQEGFTLALTAKVL